MNNEVDNYIENLSIGDKIDYRGEMYKILDKDIYAVTLIGINEENEEEKIKIEWGEISLDYEIQLLENKY